MTLRVSYLVAALALLSLGNSNVRVNAQDCTEDEQAVIDSDYASIESAAYDACLDDVCAVACQDEVAFSVATLPDCTSSDGVNYYASLVELHSCTETDGACTEEEDTTTIDSIDEAALDDCHLIDPCEATCLQKLEDLAFAVPDCTDAAGDNYYTYYQGFVDGCSGETTTEETEAPEVTTAAPSTETETETETEAPTTDETETETSTESATGSTASETESTASSAASAEEETASASASTAGSSSDNGAAAVGGSAIGSLVVAGTLALLAAQN